MITQFCLDTKHGNKGTPVRLISLEPGGAWVQLPNGQEVSVKPDFVSSGIHSPEETLSVLADQSGVREDTLLKAAQTDRLMTRRSGSAWLSTLNAIEWAIAEGRLRDPNKKAPPRFQVFVNDELIGQVESEDGRGVIFDGDQNKGVVTGPKDGPYKIIAKYPQDDGGWT